MRGVLNLRGVVVPIIDLRCRFGEGLTDCTPTHIIIIVHVEGRQMGSSWPTACWTSYRSSRARSSRCRRSRVRHAFAFSPGW